jgi:hypothetical protein
VSLSKSEKVVSSSLFCLPTPGPNHDANMSHQCLWILAMRLMTCCC